MQRVRTIGNLKRVTYGGDGPTSQFYGTDVGCLGVPMHGENGVTSCDLRRMHVGLAGLTFSPHTAATSTSAGMPAGSKPSTVSGLYRAHHHAKARAKAKAKAEAKKRLAHMRAIVEARKRQVVTSSPSSDAMSTTDPSAPANSDSSDDGTSDSTGLGTGASSTTSTTSTSTTSGTAPPDDPTADTSDSTILFGESLPTLLVWGALAVAIGYGAVKLLAPAPRPRVSDTARRRPRRRSRRR